MKKMMLLLLALPCLPFISEAQLFSKITDAANPIVSSAAQTTYTGAAWVDYDMDGKLDLFIPRAGLFHNEGNGNFTDVTTQSGISIAGGLGTTWADMDNDGDPDCFISAGFSFGSRLFINNGNGTFTQDLSGPLADPTKLRGWSSAWGDYDNDGMTDLLIAAPVNFAGITDSNKLLHNDGGGNFTRIDTTILTCCEKPYTVGTWNDYDLDGDLDVFIGSGPATGIVEVDYMYENQLSETGVSTFTNTVPSPLSTDKRDGQVWNWIDFDNDGDLDGYVTNYVGIDLYDGYPNDFYRNDNGTYVKLTAADAGPIVGDNDISLANTWQDFDNDGDLDCIVINDAGIDNRYYQNNIMQGSAVFTKVTNEPFVPSPGNSSFSVTAGDYDKDGDVDLFVTAASSAHGLYKNQLANGNGWVDIHLTGVTSNKSAIGAQVRLKATINGNTVWQMRDVSAQNSFNAMNSLNLEFGLGNATVIDSIIIKWPSGTVDRCANIAINQFYEALEGNCISTGMGNSTEQPKGSLQSFPNPFSDQCHIRYTAAENGYGIIEVRDAIGNHVQTLAEGMLSPGTHDFIFQGEKMAPGIYFIQLNSATYSCAEKIVLMK